MNTSVSKALVIAEKPSVAQDIVRALTPAVGKFEKHAEHFENDTHVVTSAVGHLVVGLNTGEVVSAPSGWEDSGRGVVLKPEDRRQVLARADLRVERCDCRGAHEKK